MSEDLPADSPFLRHGIDPDQLAGLGDLDFDDLQIPDDLSAWLDGADGTTQTPAQAQQIQGRTSRGWRT